jgi:hypothetical protein
MKITENHCRAGVIIIAVVYIAYGFLKPHLHMQIDAGMEKTIGTVLMVIAAGLFLYGRSLRNKASITTGSNTIVEKKEDSQGK